jgi:adenylate cyclase
LLGGVEPNSGVENVPIGEWLMDDSTRVIAPAAAVRDAKTASFVEADATTTVLGVYEGQGRPISGPNITDWILREGRSLESLPELFDQFCWRLVGHHLPIWRATLHGFRLHPQILGLGLRWWHDQGLVEEFAVKRGAENDVEFALSPIRSTVLEGVLRRFAPGDRGWQELPLLQRLAALGVTDYVAMPLGRFNTRAITATFATLAPDGFDEREFGLLRALAPALGAVVESHFLKRVTLDLMQIYLGQEASSRVIAGDIVRGKGVGVRAIVMATDLREFTRISDLLPAGDIIELLDDYFDCVCGAVQAQGGEVLKFIGDGVLAIFPTQGNDPTEVAARAIAAARNTLKKLDDLNQTRAWSERPMLKAGIGLHLGDVIFGNVGAVDRLDFTVIGPDVNLAFRLESLTKRLKIPIVTSRAFADAAPQQFTSLGFERVYGRETPVEVFSFLIS